MIPQIANPDCPKILSLATHLKMDRNSALFQTIQSNCCNADGIVCGALGVTQIKWNKLGLDGRIHANDIPSGIVILDLGSNQITGDVSFMYYLPNSITNLDLHDNNLRGEIPIFQISLVFVDFNANQISGRIPALPFGMTSLNLSNNNLSGPVPAIPKGMQDLQFFSNDLEGTIEISRPRILYIDRNSFTGIKIDDYISLTPGNCHIGDNALKEDPSYLASYCDLSDNPTPPLIPAPVLDKPVRKPPTPTVMTINPTNNNKSPTPTISNFTIREPTYAPVKDIWSADSVQSEPSNDGSLLPGILITIGILFIFAVLLYFTLPNLIYKFPKKRPVDDGLNDVEKQETETGLQSEPAFMSFAASFSSIVSSSIFTISTNARTTQSTRFTLKDFI